MDCEKCRIFDLLLRPRTAGKISLVIWHPGHESKDEVIIDVMHDSFGSVRGTGATIEEAVNSAKLQVDQYF